jgi:hypothetical protein
MFSKAQFAEYRDEQNQTHNNLGRDRICVRQPKKNGTFFRLDRDHSHLAVTHNGEPLSIKSEAATQALSGRCWRCYRCHSWRNIDVEITQLTACWPK